MKAHPATSPPPLRRGWPAALLALALGWAAGPALGQDAPAAPKAVAPALPPEVEAKFAEFAKKLDEAERKRWDTEAKQEIEAVVKATGLEARSVPTLETAAARAADLAAEEVENVFAAEVRREYAKNPAQVMAGWDQTAVTMDMVAANDQQLHYTRPLNQPAWLEALAHTLTPEQAAAWRKARPESDPAEEKAINDFLDTQAAFNRQQYTPALDAAAGEIIAGLDLPKERADALTELSKRALDASLAALRKGLRKRLLTDYTPEARQQVIKSKNSYYGAEENEQPEQQAVWKEGLARLLSDEDRARLAAAREAQRARRARALGQLLVKAVDEKVALTDAQRPRLEGLAARLAAAETQFFPTDNQSRYTSYNLQTFYQAAAKAKPEEVRPLLDDLQWQHWRELGHLKNPPGSDDEGTPAPAPPPAKADAAAPAAEPEAAEHAISDYLQTRCAAEQQRLVGLMILQAEDAARTVQLEPAARARLQTAARGAAEAALATWASSTEQNVRSEVQDATPENVRQKLAGASNYGYADRSDPQASGVWKAAAADLTPAQQAAWQAERDARARYGEAAVAEFVLAEFDRQVSLTPAQWERLAPVIARAVRDYQPELANYFSYSNGSAWYLYYYSELIPFHAVPEAEFKALLTPAQWERWLGCPGYQNSASYWSNIQQNHESRTKQKQP